MISYNGDTKRYDFLAIDFNFEKSLCFGNEILKADFIIIVTCLKLLCFLIVFFGYRTTDRRRYLNLNSMMDYESRVTFCFSDIQNSGCDDKYNIINVHK